MHKQSKSRGVLHVPAIHIYHIKFDIWIHEMFTAGKSPALFSFLITLRHFSDKVPCCIAHKIRELHGLPMENQWVSYFHIQRHPAAAQQAVRGLHAMYNA